MVDSLLTPKEVANSVVVKFADAMDLYALFIFNKPDGACKVCRSVMAIVREEAKRVRLSAEQIDEAVLEAQPLFIEWLRKYTRSGKGELA